MIGVGISSLVVCGGAAILLGFSATAPTQTSSLGYSRPIAGVALTCPAQHLNVTGAALAEAPQRPREIHLAPPLQAGAAEPLFGDAAKSGRLDSKEGRTGASTMSSASSDGQWLDWLRGSFSVASLCSVDGRGREFRQVGTAPARFCVGPLSVAIALGLAHLTIGLCAWSFQILATSGANRAAIQGRMGRNPPARADEAYAHLGLGAFAHDFRGSLQRMRMRLESLAPSERAGLEADIASMEALAAAAVQAARRGNEAHRAVFDLSALCVDLCAAHEGLGPRAIMAPCGPILICADRIEIARAIGNLIDNALHYAGEAKIVLRATDLLAKISVQDEGPGFTFGSHHDGARSNPPISEDGHGLGLAIAASIARAHGGALTLTNLDTGGACATLVIPRNLNRR